MSDQPLVELHECYFFDCDNCGREAIVRPIFVTFEQVMAAENENETPDADYVEMLRSLFEASGGRLHEKPSFVTCPHCDTTFEVEENY